MKMLKVTLLYDGEVPQASYVTSFADLNLDDLFDGAEPGDGCSFRLELIPEMSEEEYRSLPDFAGF